MNDEYGKVHRNFLNLLMSKGVFSYDEAMLCLKTIPKTNDTLPMLIEKINSRIAPFEQKMKIVTNEFNECKEIVFIDLGDDSIDQFGKKLSKADIQYLKLLLERIILSTSKCISEIDALNLSSSVTQKPFGMSQAKNLLKTWLDGHYLKKLEDNYFLDSRAIHEYEKYFKEKYPDNATDCFNCKKFVYKPKSCNDCGVNFHIYCHTDLRTTTNKCPNCKEFLMPLSGENDSD